VSPTDDLDRTSVLRRVRGVIERLVRDGTALARSDARSMTSSRSRRAPPRGDAAGVVVDFAVARSS
jgi:hypothetical protein